MNLETSTQVRHLINYFGPGRRGALSAIGDDAPSALATIADAAAAKLAE